MDTTTKARRRALGVLLLALSAATAACSASSPNVEGGSSAPAPVVQEVPEAQYTAEFPCAPVREEMPFRASGIDLSLVYFRCITAKEEVGVGFIEYPKTAKVSLLGAAEGSAEGLNGKIQSKTDTTFMGHPAMDIVVNTPDGLVFERLVLRAGTRLYTLIGSGGAGRPPAYDRLIETFVMK